MKFCNLCIMCMKPTDAAPSWAHSFFKSDGREPLHCRLPFCTSARWAVGRNWGLPFVQCFYNFATKMTAMDGIVDMIIWEVCTSDARGRKSKEATGIGWTSCDAWWVFFRLLRCPYSLRRQSHASASVCTSKNPKHWQPCKNTVHTGRNG